MFYIIPTIDVEGVHGQTPFEQMILGRVSDKEWGIKLLAEIFNKYDVQATFFVDVFEYTLWGKGKCVTHANY